MAKHPGVVKRPSAAGLKGKAAKVEGLGLKSAKPAAWRAGRLTFFLDPKGYIVVDRVIERFGMSKQQFAETIGVKPETVYRASRVSAPKTQARATEMLEIVARIADWAGGERQAMAWYRAEPIPAFGERTAEALVKAGKAAAVRDYLDHVATGGFA
jgi:DNA-binding XRE family transcriptional regulator